MNNKELVAIISKNTSIEEKDVSLLLDGFIQTLREKFSNLDSIAIPGFGEFIAFKEDEIISLDYTSGKRYLLPPQVGIKFTCSSLLKKKMVD